MTNYWTKGKVDRLTKLWEKGVSARKISETLGNISRNAVIGKANRLGLSKKNEETKKIQHKSIDLSLLVPNMSGCKWPIGHPGDADFYFCGKPTILNKPYCGEHCLIAYRKKDNGQKVKKIFKIENERN